MRRRFAFSVEWMLALTVMVAIAIAALTAKPLWISILAIRVTLIAILGLVAVMAIQGKPLVRAFGIGAAFPALVGAILAVVPLFVQIPEELTREDHGMQVMRTFGDLAEADLRFRAAFLLSASFLSGLAGIALAWLVFDSADPR